MPLSVGDLGAIQHIADSLDGKAVQAIERSDVPLEAMTDQQLMAIIRGGSCEPLKEPKHLMICPPLASVVTRWFHSNFAPRRR